MIECCMRMAVCDDDPRDLEQIAAMVRTGAQLRGTACELTLYESGAELLAAIQNGEKYHALWLDVLMDEMDGMELAALRSLHDQTAIVFISCNREMALKGYEVSALRYLAKPIDPDRLGEALMACFRAGWEKKEILLPAGNG